MPPAGEEPGAAGFEIAVSLREYARRTGQGRAFPDGVGFRVHLPHRESVSPDAAYHIGSRMGMRFAEGAPIFAVEVRSENDYGRAAEEQMKQIARRLFRLRHSRRMGRGFTERGCGERVSS